MYQDIIWGMFTLRASCELPDLDLGKNFYGIIEDSVGKSWGVIAGHLCTVWSISKEEADRTIKYTTQVKQQDMNGPIFRN